MRKLTAVIALAFALTLSVPSATFAAGNTAPKTRSSNVREDNGPRDGDLIGRVIHFIMLHLHLTPNDDTSPIIPVP